MSDIFSVNGLTRRAALGVVAASASMAPLAAQTQSPTPSPVQSRLLPGATMCVLTPQAVEGPYYFDPKLERADITEGKPGVPLGLVLQVVNAASCAPLKGARVDVWHADALGVYSGYPGQTDARNVSTEGQHFLRGTQFADANGLATFTTIYPGWYHGRTPHIHCKVFLDSTTVLTTQLYFPDALSAYIYAHVAPYNTRGRERDTVNATDMIVKMSGDSRASFCSIKEEADRYVASLIVGVDRDAKVVALGPMGPPPGGPPPGGPPPVAALPKGPLVPGIVKTE